MSTAAEHIQVLYEIAMSIGVSLDLQQILKTSVSNYLRKLNLCGGSVLRLQNTAKGLFQFEPVLSIPHKIERVEAYRAALQLLPQAADAATIAAFFRLLPVSGSGEKQTSFHILDLPDFGVLILLKCAGEIDPFLLKSIDSLNCKLARACLSCLQNEALTRSHQELIETNKELTAATVALERSQQALLGVMQEMKEKEEALRRSEIKYRTIFENVQDVFYQTDYHGRITEISPSIERHSGYTREELWSRQLVEFYEDANEYFQLCEQLAKHGEVNDFEIRLKGKNGRLIFTSVNAHVLKDTEGNPIATDGTLRDITERKLAEDALRKTSSRLSALIENLQAGILVEDENRQIVLANQAFCDFFGIPLPPQQLIGMDCSDSARQVMGLFQEPERFVSRIDEILRQRTIVSNEEIRMADGRVLERDYVPIYVAADYRGHLWQYRNITERIRLQEQLQFQLSMEKAVSALTGEFINLPPEALEFGITKALGQIGQFIGADRCAIGLFDEKGERLQKIYLWPANRNEMAGALAGPALPNLPPHWLEKFKSGKGVLHLPVCLEILADANKATLAGQDLTMHVTLPLHYGENSIGFLGFCRKEVEEAWLKRYYDFMEIICEIFANVLTRQKTEKMLVEYRDHLEELVQLRTEELKKANTKLLAEIEVRTKAEKELANSNLQLRNLSAHLIRVREDERTGVAREIHDELGQVLTALNMDLAWLKNKLPVGEHGLQMHVESMSKLVLSTVKQVQRIITELRPTILDNLGLLDALDWQINTFRQRTGIVCEVDIDRQLRFSQTLSTVIFRIVQEGLTNIMRHAGASRVAIRLQANNGQIELTIADNGRGIPKRALTQPTSYGLLGLRDRASLCGGNVNIASEIGRGVTITVTFPYPQEELP